MLTRKKDISIRQLKELYFAQRNTHLQLHEMMQQLGLLGIEDNEPDFKIYINDFNPENKTYSKLKDDTEGLPF